MEKVEALEDMVSLAPSSLVKVKAIHYKCWFFILMIMLIETTGKINRFNVIPCTLRVYPFLLSFGFWM